MTPEQRQFRDRIVCLEGEWARVATLTDLLATRTASVSGKREWSDETELAYLTAVIPHRG